MGRGVVVAGGGGGAGRPVDATINREKASVSRRNFAGDISIKSQREGIRLMEIAVTAETLRVPERASE